MAFVQVNGLDIPVKSAGRIIEEPGLVMSRSVAGSMRKHRRAVKRGLRFETIIVAESDAEHIENLLLGAGHVFPFDTDYYSAQKGLGPNTGYSGVSIVTGASAKLGAGALALDASGAIAWDLGFSGDWSVMCWQFRDSDWYHLAVIYDADAASYVECVNGAAGSGINDTWRALVSSGTLTLQGKAYNDDNAEAVRYDDVVAVPYKLDSEVIAWHYNSGTGRAFSHLPQLSVTGDVFKTTTPKTMLASVGDQGYIQAAMPTFAANNRTLQFEMFEV